MDLRPLGFGEIFDRAITTCVRHFAAFAGIVAVVVAPLAVLQYFLDKWNLPQLDQTFAILGHRPHATPVMPAYFTSPGAALLLVGGVLLSVLLWAFALNACAVGVARLYRGRAVAFAECYAAALSKWASVLALMCVDCCIILAWYIVIFLAVFTGAFVAAISLRISLAIGVVAVIVAIALVIAAVLLFGPIFVAITFAMNAIVIERVPVHVAIGRGFARIFNRDEFWRTLLFSLAGGAIVIGASMLSAAVAYPALFVHQVWLATVATMCVTAATQLFTIVTLSVYYFDVRIRREGFDLEADLERLASGPQNA